MTAASSTVVTVGTYPKWMQVVDLDLTMDQRVVIARLTINTEMAQNKPVVTVTTPINGLSLMQQGKSAHMSAQGHCRSSAKLSMNIKWVGRNSKRFGRYSHSATDD